MIKSKFGHVEMEGSKGELMADFSCIVETFGRNADSFSEEKVRAAFERGLEHSKKPDDEKRNELMDMVSEKLAELLKEAGIYAQIITVGGKDDVSGSNDETGTEDAE